MSNGSELGATASGFPDEGQTVADSLPFSSSTVSEQGPPSGGSGSNSGGYPSLNFLPEEEEDPKLVRHDDKYFCPVCKRLLREPVQTPCGHRMCQACVASYLGSAVSKACPAKEEDCEEVKRDNIFPDPGFKRELKQLLVFCPNNPKGCKQEIRLGILQKHKGECEYREVRCRHSDRGCGEVILFKDAEKHEKGCGFQPVSCDLCGSEFNKNSKEDHESQQCPEALVICPYKCGKQGLKRKDLEDHKMACPKKPTECKFKNLGCTFTGNKEEVARHEKDINIHFNLILEYTVTSKEELRKCINDLRDLKHNQEDLKRTVDRVDGSLKTIHKELRLKLVQQVERVIIMEQRMGEINQESTTIRQEQAQLKQSIDQLKALIPQVQNFDRQIASHEIRMAEMDLRFQMLETASYDGKLLWKIRDYSHRKRDAVQGRTVSLYSQPFYTSRTGYKMCARVYLNGDGIGRGTHMSLYFVVMKGEYDALLPWPFQNKVSLILMDQSSERRHLKDDFHPDPNSTSFRRPTNAEMNVASGCPLFVAQTVLDNTTNQYVKDDMLFIKVVVETAGIPSI